MESYSGIVVKLLVGSVLLGGCSARPLEPEDYRQYQNNGGGNSYGSGLMSAAPGTFGASQSGFSSLANPTDLFMPQAIPQSSLNSYAGSPFGGQQYGTSNYGVPAGYSAGMANYFG